MENNRTIRLYDYHVWANKLVIQHLRQLPNKAYKETVKSVFTSIHDVMIHLYTVDMIWLGTMKGNRFQDTIKEIERRKSEVSGASLDELEVFYDELSSEFYDFLGEQQDLEQTIVAEHPQYGQCEFVLADLIHHVVNHGTYHRGNVSAMLHQQGKKGVPTDYVFFLLK
ncbi:damage-inducible protein DinB [Siminovitchia acidinfaciens]|uniref:Damage-inducible protein DinB n=1 Tax=Siminovitchia acidinfaciens TaxID=2321395 RepID=A0A429XUW5_9BACI|nr:DinB family protein [Siminovitchia acidinfaciens]RST71979.1 damage-inducible protein DinB [Siminovitchia acidinfaciens]